MSLLTEAATTTKPIWIVGASGLLAGELARLLEAHPGLHLSGVISRRSGQSLRELHPQLTSELTTLELQSALPLLAEELDAVATGGPVPGLFLGLPHGESGDFWKALSSQLGPSAQDLAVVDLSADYRLQDPELYEATYGRAHPDPEGAEGFVYGLPEMWRGRVRESRRVAAPGCFATAMQLAVLPAAIAGKLNAEVPWILHGVTGSSGSGISPNTTTHHPFRHGSYKAYSPGGHRHEAELKQALAEWFLDPPLHFIPHSGPWSRGIHMTCSLPLSGEHTLEELHEVYASHYAKEPFIEVLGSGGIPELRAVLGSNRVSLGVHVRDSVLTVLLALDNTIKGGAGQALQCMNLLQGEPEDAGLSAAGLGY
ncbi:MAG: N-acetyl-gamma-glutamyl-phosphate/LysW-gamma-L-alpha-aminoadipyl-6-phosphate reductase [Candidatus Paceibacteria bacterium]|jgi:N-acetyl-gamma-glutamyl-phosphate/LysW-gamma-L-alpha-aminoadipyl-6-phosphate reductase